MIPESAVTNRDEPLRAPGSVPGDEVSSESAKRMGAREVLLAQGKQLAESVIFQYERFCRAPFNAEESARLRGLQGAFVAWERHANAQCPGLDTASEFPDSRLRPFERKVTVNDLARARRAATPLEAHFKSIRLARQAQTVREEKDDGFWCGMPQGI